MADYTNVQIAAAEAMQSKMAALDAEPNTNVLARATVLYLARTDEYRQAIKILHDTGEMDDDRYKRIVGLTQQAMGVVPDNRLNEMYADIKPAIGQALDGIIQCFRTNIDPATQVAETMGGRAMNVSFGAPEASKGGGCVKH